MYHHNFDPIILEFFGLTISYYKLAYIIGYLLIKYNIEQTFNKTKNRLMDEKISTLLIFGFIGFLFGARIFYIIFYDIGFYIENPIEIIKINKGGLSFHGGLLGGILGIALFCKRYDISTETVDNEFSSKALNDIDSKSIKDKNLTSNISSEIFKHNFLKILDSVVLVLPIGIFLGRIGNFMNSELYGKVTDVPWAVIFEDGLPRHPSQIYESLSEGLLLFILLLMYKKYFSFITDKNPGMICILFGLLYSEIRFVNEIFKDMPIYHISYKIYLDISIIAILIASAFFNKIEMTKIHQQIKALSTNFDLLMMNLIGLIFTMITASYLITLLNQSFLTMGQMLSMVVWICCILAQYFILIYPARKAKNNLT